MKMKKFISMLMIAACVCSMAACGSKEKAGSEEEKGGEEKKTLIMATNAEFPPYEYHEGDDIVGIDAEMAAAVAEELGMDFKIEDMAFDSIIPAVDSGKADIGVAGMTVTEDRLQNVNFSEHMQRQHRLLS